MKLRLSAYKVIDGYAQAGEQEQLNTSLAQTLNAESSFRINDKASRPKLRACHYFVVDSEDESILRSWADICEANDLVILTTAIEY